jgi:hypothetical protein
MRDRADQLRRDFKRKKVTTILSQHNLLPDRPPEANSRSTGVRHART